MTSKEFIALEAEIVLSVFETVEVNNDFNDDENLPHGYVDYTTTEVILDSSEDVVLSIYRDGNHLGRIILTDSQVQEIWKLI